MVDQLIMFCRYNGKKNCLHTLRRMVVWNNENKREIVLLTNHLDLGANTFVNI